MKYFLDTEFHEYKRKPYWSKPVDTIELISIGIVSEDGREYYAISKDFDVKAAWNNVWLRDNVLKPIYYELLGKDINYHELHHFTRSNFKKLIQKYGKSNKQIAEEIKKFIVGDYNCPDLTSRLFYQAVSAKNNPPEFYGYYCDYDWVVFCWLFGRMIDLPKGFPKFCLDLNQMLDEKAANFTRSDFFTAADFLGEGLPELTLKEKVEHLKKHVRYPDQTNEHHALQDAKWNYELYKFLQSLK